MSNSTFVKGLVGLMVFFVLCGFGIYKLDQREERPEGVAEDYLAALSDTTRKGVEADSLRRAEKLGSAEGADRRLLFDDTRGKTAFADIEVGKAVRVDPANPDKVRVGFRVHTRRVENLVKVAGAMTLERTNGKWRETLVEIVGDANTSGAPAAQVLAGVPDLPSDGGPPPSSAPFSLWIAGVVGSLLIGAVCAGLITLAGRDAPLPAAAAV